MKPQPFGVRDLFWLAMLALILAVWGWDRGRLATRLEMLEPKIAPQTMPPGATGSILFTEIETIVDEVSVSAPMTGGSVTPQR